MGNVGGGAGEMEGAREGHNEQAGPSAKLSEQHFATLTPLSFKRNQFLLHAQIKQSNQIQAKSYTTFLALSS